MYEAGKVNLVNVRWPAKRASYELAEAAEKVGVDSGSLSSTLAQTYRELAVNAKDNNRQSEASAFHYDAQDTLRQNNSWIVLSPRWWYWLLSGYGQRPGRAFLALVAILVAFAVLFSEMVDVGIGQAFVYSFLLIVRQVPRPEFSDANIETLFQFLVALETLFVLLQMGLFLQAVKNWVTRQ
jgi:hypothetical protein